MPLPQFGPAEAVAVTTETQALVPAAETPAEPVAPTAVVIRGLLVSVGRASLRAAALATSRLDPIQGARYRRPRALAAK